MPLASGTRLYMVDVLVLALLFFAVRWQARDIYNNLRISLTFLMIVGFIGYALVYAAFAFSVFSNKGLTGRAKAFVALALMWSLMWMPLWAVVLALSKPKAIVPTAADENLTPPEPVSALARGTIVTSIDACNRLADCENSSTQRNYLNLVDKQVKCEACLSSHMCPATVDGVTQCVARTSRDQCTRACVPSDLIDRFARNSRCPNAVAYATLTGDASDVATVCQDDRGLCVYGCDVPSTDGVCTTGWRSYENEHLGEVLDEVEPDMGYPSEAKCAQKHRVCTRRDCASAPIAPPLDRTPNCYCDRVYAPAQEPPCRRLERLCDKTSPQYAAAQALRRSYAVQDDIKTIDDGKVATSVRGTDQSLSNALRF